VLSLLSEIATVKSGYPFRGKIAENKQAKTYAVQIKDINELNEIEWANVMSTQLIGRKQPDWLKKGDILFAARGLRNVAVCIGDVTLNAVCAQHFFHIKLKQNARVLPAFLVWQLNQFPAQKYLSQSAEGSAQLSIRRGVVEAIPITIPSLKQQQTLVNIYNHAQQEKKLLTALINNRSQQMQSIAQKLLTNTHPAASKEK